MSTWRKLSEKIPTKEATVLWKQDFPKNAKADSMKWIGEAEWKMSNRMKRIQINSRTKCGNIKQGQNTEIEWKKKMSYQNNQYEEWTKKESKNQKHNYIFNI